MLLSIIILFVLGTATIPLCGSENYELQRDKNPVDGSRSGNVPSLHSQSNGISATARTLSSVSSPSPVYPDAWRGFESQQSPHSEPVPKSAGTSHTSFARSGFKLLQMLFVVYAIVAAVFMYSRKAQTYLIYLHWILPPLRWFPLTDLQAQRLSHTGRNINAGGLRGWHIVPAGPPFPPLFASIEAKDAYYEQRLSTPRQRVIIFFHGNCGTRAFPPKRVRIIKLLNAQLSAHMITFDYSGFGDSVGSDAPSERTFLNDACAIVQWVRGRVHATTSVYLYGQSLGTFAASHAAAHFSTDTTTPSASADLSYDGTYDFQINSGCEDVEDVNHRRADISLSDRSLKQGITGVILDAPPVSLQTAALTHPVLLGFRAFGLTPLFKSVIRESLDSTRAVARLRCPLLVMHGRKDSMIPAWQGKFLADTAKAGGNKRVTYREFGNVGHVDVSGAEGYLITLYNFIKQCEKDSDRGPTTCK